MMTEEEVRKRRAAIQSWIDEKEWWAHDMDQRDELLAQVSILTEVLGRCHRSRGADVQTDRRPDSMFDLPQDFVQSERRRAALLRKLPQVSSADGVTAMTPRQPNSRQPKRNGEVVRALLQ